MSHGYLLLVNGRAGSDDLHPPERIEVEEGGIRSVIVVTNPIYSRRAKWVFEKVLNGKEKREKIKIQMATIECNEYDSREWWKTEAGLVAVNNEYIKWGYYLVRY